MPDKILGLSMPFKVGTRVVEIHPVLLKDWKTFSKTVGVFEMRTLYELFSYSDAPGIFEKGLKIVCRLNEDDPLPELFNEMTQADYERLRAMIIEQNDLNFEEMQEVVKKKEKRAEELISSLVSKKA